MNTQHDQPYEESERDANINEGAETTDENAETLGSDVIDQRRHGATQGRTVIDHSAENEVEEHGVDVIDHSRAIEERGVIDLDKGPQQP